jgi:surface polysaccharide O-acyltransferase-like enzyme
VDVVRVLTFACVIAVHALSRTNSGASTKSADAGMLLHFTREAFFVLTAFVLFHTHYRKPLAVQQFWRKRLTLVGVPYLLWTLIYNVNSATPHVERASWWQHLGYDLLTGRACYHLYFLLVSLQIYLLMPVLLWIVRRTEGHHGLLFAGAAGLELAITYGLHDVVGNAPLAGVPGVIANHSDTMLPSYLLYVCAGALAAVHLTRWQGWVDRHWRLIGIAFVATLAFTLWAHDAQIHGPSTIGYATAVLQPAMIPWSIVTVAGLYALGSAWARRSATGPVSRRTELVLQKASHASFGIYLVHPLFLDYLTSHGFGLPHSFLPPPASTILVVVVVAVMSYAVVEVLSRTPLSLALTGRPRQRPARPQAENIDNSVRREASVA